MCKLVEEYARERAEEAAREAREQERKQVILKMLQRGYRIDQILELYTNLDEEAILQIKAEM